MLPILVDLLLLVAAAPSRAADTYESALIAAVHHFAREGSLDHLRAILDRHPNLVDALEPIPPVHKPFGTEGYTPLAWAARSGNTPVAAYLIGRGAKVNAADGLGWTPLHLGALAGHLDVVKLLVENGADTGAKTAAIPESSGVLPGSPPSVPGSPAEPPKTYPAIPARTPLEWAVEKKQAEVVAYLRSLKK
jgi:ankyrin repeat protein